MKEACIICGKPIDNANTIKCAVCGVLMHRSCASDEALLDAEENSLCPYDAMIAALDWFDAVVSEYVDILNNEQRNDVIGRLRSYLNLLEGKET